MKSTELPLFPLQTVLFPGGALSLRIFEQRYLDMVRECSRTNSGFGVVCAWPAGSHRGPSHARVGTEAMIVDFSTLDDGLLGLTCRGQRRFRIRETRARENGLLVASIDWLPPEPATPVPARFGALQTLMLELQQHRDIGAGVDVELEEAGSLGRGLAALLEFEAEHAQALLEMTDPVARLEGILGLLHKGGHS